MPSIRFSDNPLSTRRIPTVVIPPNDPVGKLVLPNNPPVSTVPNDIVFPNSSFVPFPNLGAPLDFIPSGIMPIRALNTSVVSSSIGPITLQPKSQPITLQPESQPTTLQPESQPTTLQPESQSQQVENIDPSVYMIVGGVLIVAFFLLKK